MSFTSKHHFGLNAAYHFFFYCDANQILQVPVLIVVVKLIASIYIARMSFTRFTDTFYIYIYIYCVLERIHIVNRHYPKSFTWSYSEWRYGSDAIGLNQFQMKWYEVGEAL